MTIQKQAAPTVAAPAASRWPATAVFFLSGLTLTTYLVQMPALKTQHHLTDGQLGIFGMLFATAALASMQFVGALVSRVGSGPVLRASLAVMPVLLGLVGLAGGVGLLAAVTVALGVVNGAADAAMNAHAIAVQRLNGRVILNGCHAGWSIGAVVASSAAAALARAGISSTGRLVGVSAVLFAGALLVAPFLLPGKVDRGHAGSRARTDRSGRGGWTRPIVALGLTGMALMVCEGAALGWGAVFLHDTKGVSIGLAATAIAAFTGGQTGGRLVGDHLTARYGAVPVFRVGGLIATCGLTVVVLAQHPIDAIMGFAIVGLGMSVLLPLTFNAVGQTASTGPDAARAVSRFTTFTYAGVLVGPAVIGLTADHVGLTATIAALIPVVLAVAGLTRLVRPTA
jgi:MFS family permease